LKTWYSEMHNVHDDFVIAYANATANELCVYTLGGYRRVR